MQMASCTQGKRIWQADAEAEKLYKLAQALQRDESREKKTMLRELCSKWGVTDRDDGETKRAADIMQQLAEVAKRAYIQWRSKPKPTRKRKAQQQDGATKLNINKRTYHVTRPSTSTERSRRERGQPVGQARKVGRKPKFGKAMTGAERARKSRHGKMMAACECDASRAPGAPHLRRTP